MMEERQTRAHLSVLNAKTSAQSAIAHVFPAVLLMMPLALPNTMAAWFLSRPLPTARIVLRRIQTVKMMVPRTTHARPTWPLARLTAPHPIALVSAVETLALVLLA